MDAQTRIRDTAALTALVQCLVRCEALGELAEPELSHAPEVLDENRFLAARDGIEAQLLDPHRDRCVPASGRLATLVDACWPHARELGCERELALLAHLAGDPGAARQRAIASEPAGLRGLLHTLQAEFSPGRRDGRGRLLDRRRSAGRPALPAARSPRGRCCRRSRRPDRGADVKCAWLVVLGRVWGGRICTSPAPAWLCCTDDRLPPVCPPLAGHSTPGSGTLGTTARAG